MRTAWSWLTMCWSLVGCAPDSPGEDWSTWTIPDRERSSGDPDAGWEALTTGGYVGAGVPYDIWMNVVGEDPSNRLGRTGDNASLSYDVTAFDAPNGVRVVGGLNCFGCHASWVEGEFVVGLGNSFSDFTDAGPANLEAIATFVQASYPDGTPEWEAFYPLLRGVRAVGTEHQTPFQGVNPAFRLEEMAARFRDPSSLEWQVDPVFDAMDAPQVASDVPPWWHVNKKHGLYYNGMSRGDVRRQLMQIMVVAIDDADHAEAFEADFDNVLAWLEALEAPVYPGEVDAIAASRGKTLFETHCSRCHGTYGAEETYPNLLVHLDVVGTDPERALAFAERSGLVDWNANSWFGEDGTISAEPGYVAPPLDGIWASAPYLHNGSVPSLATLLDSTTRPVRWKRDFTSSALDHDAMGWPWTAPDANDTGTDVYDTSLFGYGAGGHTFGDGLEDAERSDLIAYLKTL